MVSVEYPNVYYDRILNSFIDGTNASLCPGKMLKNNNTTLE
jgi:hypothetical protein